MIKYQDFKPRLTPPWPLNRGLEGDNGSDSFGRRSVNFRVPYFCRAVHLKRQLFTPTGRFIVLGIPI
ncbi:hypothetical protein PCANC_08867 [Puccinia coronata f. sp. avenae]|uniref:Uncharacterized protein n=1 Tax=Puccinia coronata f. sp. avenae TaxID=200324 RepID=A0A2N5VS52_9BASI|nr:hypothetical protein PCANC_08867 [Puccinia coronata f. sp. avenae]